MEGSLHDHYASQMNTITSSPVLFPVRKPLHPAPIVRWIPGDTPTDNKPFRMVPASYMETASHLDEPGCCALIDPTWLDQDAAKSIAIANRANPFMPPSGPLEPISPPSPRPRGLALKEVQSASGFPIRPPEAAPPANFDIIPPEWERVSVAKVLKQVAPFDSWMPPGKRRKLHSASGRAETSWDEYLDSICRQNDKAYAENRGETWTEFQERVNLQDAQP